MHPITLPAWAREGEISVRKIAINRVTDERAENNWSMCVIRGRCRCQHAARAALIRLDQRLAETALLLGALSEDTRHRPLLAKLLLESGEDPRRHR